MFSGPTVVGNLVGAFPRGRRVGATIVSIDRTCRHNDHRQPGRELVLVRRESAESRWHDKNSTGGVPP